EVTASPVETTGTIRSIASATAAAPARADRRAAATARAPADASRITAADATSGCSTDHEGYGEACPHTASFREETAEIPNTAAVNACPSWSAAHAQPAPARPMATRCTASSGRGRA